MNSLLIRISPAAGSLPTAITETTSTTGRGGGEDATGRYRTHMIAGDTEICKQKVSKSESANSSNMKKMTTQELEKY